MNDAVRSRTAWVEDRVRAACFGGACAPGTPTTLGAELELLALDATTNAVAPIFAQGGSLALVRAAACRLNWREAVSAKGVPHFTSAAGGSLTFEPGGQLEYASGVHASADGVLLELEVVESALNDAAEPLGISLLARGVDPFNDAEHAPLQLTAERYERMARYFASIGPDGARMMRQTASLQVNIGGFPSLERWAVANAIAPWLVALFANSSQYAGSDTDCASYRAETWRGVDPQRTGLFAGADPVREYAAFALAATAFLADDAAPAFGALRDAAVCDASLATHLSTLFPEVRPRGYLELRSIDAIGRAARMAAVGLVAGVLGDPAAARDACALLGPADGDLLRRAGRDGLREPRIAATVDDLVAIALAGCTRLGTHVVSERVQAAVIAHTLARGLTHTGSSCPF